MDNIGVAIRVRPMIQRELLRDSEEHWKVNGNTLCQVEHGVPVPSSIINPTAFIFDKVYSGNDTTESLYDEFAKPLVLKAMEGFNGTIFAYGQTGTGKTYTMMGLPENPGVIPRGINDVFDLVEMAPDREFLIRVSYMEIYNEVITDLLNAGSTHLKVRNNEKNEVFVENLSEVPITSPEDALTCLRNGERLRRFGETNMNERSSRSHTIFRITIESKLLSANPEDNTQEGGAVIVSQLNLVDLAGSERAAQTGAQGTRLKESGFINKSLLTLGTVISKLSSAGEEGFVPYRDSKLTRILQNSLGGNAKTSVIATVSAAAGEETFSTLKFASRAKTIKNKPKVNEVLDGDTMIKRYRKEINMLKRQIDEIQDLTNLKTLKTENEKMEQLLEENERMRREQQSKINSLQKMIISSTEETINKRKKLLKGARRETWCPGKLKRSLARASIDQPSLLSSISSEDEIEDEGMTFVDNTTDFILELEKEERKSLEQMKRKSSRETGGAANIKHRRSYQAGTHLTLKVNQACQTEQTAEEDSKEILQTNVDEEALTEKLKKLTAEKEEQCEFITQLKLRLDAYEASKQSDISVTENKNEDSENLPKSIIGIRRKCEDANVEVQPLRKMQLLEENDAVQTFLMPKMEQAAQTSPSKTELKEELSLANFIILEKDCQAEELQVQLRQAQDKLKEKECAIKELEDQISSLDYNDDAKCSAEEKITLLAAEVENLAAENQELRMSKEEAEKSLAEAKEEMIKLGSMFQEERDGFVHTESKLQRLKVQNDDLMWKVKELEETKESESKGERDSPNEKLAEELKSLKQQVEELQGTKAELLSSIEELEMEKSSKNTTTVDSFSKHEESMLNDTSKLNDLETVFMERAAAVEELNYKIEELQLENEALKDKTKKQESHLELLSKENVEFQAEIQHLNEKRENKDVSSGDHTLNKDDQTEELVLKIVELEEAIEKLQAKAGFADSYDEEKTKFMQQIAEQDKIINELTLNRASESQGKEIEDMKVKISELEKRNAELQIINDNAKDVASFEEINQGLREITSNLAQTLDGEEESEGRITRNEYEVLKTKVLELEEINEKLRSDAQGLVSSEAFEKLKLQIDELEVLNEDLRRELDVKAELLATVGDEDEKAAMLEETEKLKLEVVKLEEMNAKLQSEIQETNQAIVIEEGERDIVLKEEVDKLKLEIEQLEKANEELRNDIREKDASRSLGEGDNEIAVLHEEIDVLMSEINKLEGLNAELRAKIEHQSESAEIGKDIPKQQELEDLRLKIAELERTNGELREETERQATGIAFEDIRAKTEESDDLRRRIAELEQLNKELADGIKIKIEMPDALEIEIEKDLMRGEIKSLQSKVADLEVENGELQNRLSDSTPVLISNEVNKETALLNTELEEVKYKVSELEKVNEDLERKLLDNNVAFKEKEIAIEEVSLLKAELKELKSHASAANHNESTEEHFEHMTLRIMELEESNEELLAKLSKTESLEKEKNELLEMLSALKVPSSSIPLTIAKAESDENEDIQTGNEETVTEATKEEDLKRNIESLEAEKESLKQRLCELENINIELDENKKCLEKEIVDLTQRLSGLSSDLETAEERNTALMEKMNQFNQPDNSGNAKQIHEENCELKNVVLEMKQSNTDLEDKVVTLEGKCSIMSQQLALLSSDLQSAEDENVTLLEKINGLEQSNGIKDENGEFHVKELQAEIESLRLKLSESEEKLSRLEPIISDTSTATKDVEIDNEKLKVVITDLHQMKSELESKVSELEGKCSEMSQQLSLLSNDLQSAEDENVNLHEKINHLEKNVQMKESNSEKEENVSKMEEKCSKMAQQLSLLSNDLQAAEDENVTLLEKIDQLQKQNEENDEAKEQLLRALQTEFETVKSELSQNEELVASLNAEISSLKDLNEALESQLFTTNEEHSELVERAKVLENVKMEGDEEQSRLRQEIEAFDNIIQQLKTESMTKDENLVKLEQLCEESSEKMGKMEADLQILTEKEQQSLLEISELKRRRLETEESNAEQEGRQTELSKEICELRESLERLAAENTEKDSQIARLEKLVKDGEEELRKEMFEMADVVKSASEKEKAAVESLATFKKLFAETEELVAAGESRQAELLDEVVNLNASLQELKEENSRKYAEINKLQKLLESTNAGSQEETDNLREALRTVTEKEQETSKKLSHLEIELNEEIENIRECLEKANEESIFKDNEIRKLKEMNSKANEKASLRLTELSEELKTMTQREQDAVERLAKLKKQYAESEDSSAKNESMQAELSEEIASLKVQLQTLSNENEKKNDEIKNLEKMVDDSDEELYKMGIALKTSAEKEESNLEELSKLKQLLVGKNESDGRDENRNTEMQQEIAGLKDDLAKLRQQIIKKDEEIKELEKMVDDSDEEMYKMGKAIKSSMEKEEAFKEEISKLKNASAEYEAVASLKEELAEIKKKKFENFIHVGSMEKENERLKEKLVESEKAMISYQEYQEERVAGLKQELKRLMEVNSKPSVPKENKQARSVVESTALFALKSEKATLERDNTKMKAELDELSRKNNSLALEKFNLEFKFNDLKSECYHLKRGLRPASTNAETQTIKESSPSLSVTATGKENVSQKAFFDPDNLPFRKEEKDEPQQCTQQ
ncbi:centromere-associated protein E-like isoform X1 [Rhopilema esculentum]|uniref:centromere-associated protein E-like isoform X1 n=1 Tax=Rhopilema esculentum TaxID=499914 RepID=UPI0031D46C61